MKRNKKLVKSLLLVGMVLWLTPFALVQSEAAMQITSPAFEHNQSIPQKYTCQGEDINPSLQITDIPEGTVTLALIVDDPDAPVGTWVHWVVFNIPVVDQIKENQVPGDQAYNDFGKINWGGPCPPSGNHRYFFKLYALDVKIELTTKMQKADLEKAMKGHVLAEAELIGLYEKK